MNFRTNMRYQRKELERSGLSVTERHGDFEIFEPIKEDERTRARYLFRRIGDNGTLEFWAGYDPKERRGSDGYA